jgi:hypothetical protein
MNIFLVCIDAPPMLFNLPSTQVNRAARQINNYSSPIPCKNMSAMTIGATNLAKNKKNGK